MTRKIILLAVCLSAGALAWPARAVTVDETLATVDNEVILRSDIIQEIAPLLRELSQSNNPDAKGEADKAVREALDKAIENKLLYREALAAGAKIDDKDVDERIERFREQYKSQDEFNKMLEQSGETLTKFREHTRKQILALSYGNIKHKQFEKDAIVSESEIAQYYQDHQAEFSRPERVKARRIFLQVPKDAAARAKAKAQLQSLKDELAQGADFAELAKQHSQGPEAKDGGLMGWVSKGDLVGDLDTALFALAPGEVSGALETEFGVLVLKSEEKQAAGTLAYDQARVEIEPLLRGKAADLRYDAWLKELRKRGLVREFL